MPDNDNTKADYVLLESQLYHLMVSTGEYKEVHRLDTPDGVVVKMLFKGPKHVVA